MPKMRLDSTKIEPLLVEWLRILTQHLPKPTLIRRNEGHFYRYEQAHLEHAILLRLVRIVSGLNASKVLQKSGFLQEQASIQRAIDEFCEDVEFLAWAKHDTPTPLPPLHQQFLIGFFEELPSSEDMQSKKTKGRNMPSRDKIRAFLARQSGEVFDKNTAVNSSAAVHHVYSGFVHGFYPHVMDLYEASDLPFAVRGTHAFALLQDSRHDLENYWFRGVLAFAVASKAIGEAEVFRQAQNLHLSLSKNFLK
jgi:hypothetical protein